uniref:WD_REPEATS_REGION domain-containing protein n=1 Tax=Syphacia muris TaxID=451379 RepID=A0A0N5A8H2_9BILA
MGVGSSRNHPTVITKCTSPPYCIKLVGSRHVLIGGGGGASKTGVSNEIQTVLLTYGQIDRWNDALNKSSLSLRGVVTSVLETGPYATMNMDVVCIGNPESGRYLIAAGHDQYCYFYLSNGFSIAEVDGENNVPTLNFEEVCKIVSDKKPTNSYQKTVKFDKTIPGQPHFLVTAGAEGVLRIWDVSTQNLVKGGQPIKLRLELPAIHEGSIDEVDISPDGCTLLSLGASDGNVCFWDVLSGKKLTILPSVPGFSNDHRVRSAQFTNLNSANIVFVVAYNQKKRTSKSKSYLSLWAFNREKLACKLILLRMACSELISTMTISDCGNFTAIGTLSGSVGVYDTHEMRAIYFAQETHSIFVTGTILVFPAMNNDNSYGTVQFLPKVANDVAGSDINGQPNQNYETRKRPTIPGIASHLSVAVTSVSADQTVQLHSVPRRLQPSFMLFILFIILYFLWYLAREWTNKSFS